MENGQKISLSDCYFQPYSLTTDFHISHHSLCFFILIDIDGLVCEIDALIGRLESVRERGQFEWVDNVLVKALEHGHWLMITHANFCR